MNRRPPTNMRKWAKQSENRLVIAVVLFLLIVGGGLIGIIYGWGASIVGFACLLAGAALIGLLYGILGLLERWANADR